MSMASQCFDYGDDAPTRNLAKLRALSLDEKILYSQVKIREFYIAMKGKVYVSFSGGKDSTVLLHLVRSIYPDTPAVYMDTGLEYPEIREHVKTVDNVVWLKPDMTFKQVIIQEGYPVIGKELAETVQLARNGRERALNKFEDDGRYGFARHKYLLDAPFKISKNCCNKLKKNPAHRYERETGRHPYIGMRADEGALRTLRFEQKGENTLDAEHPKSNPILIWTEEDIWAYIRRFNLPYATIYDKGVPRTGCIFCMFGITMEKDRFLRLKATHPQLWAYCMKPIEDGGLGMKEVLDYMSIPTGCEQTTLDEYGGRE